MKRILFALVPLLCTLGATSAHAQEIAELQKLNLLEEKAGRFGNAIAGWGKILTNKALLDQLNNKGLAEARQRRAKEVYFDAYYHTVYCTFMYGKHHKVKEKSDLFVKRAGDKIQQLKQSEHQEGWNFVRPSLVELVTNEPLLLAQPGMKEIVQKFQK